MKYYKDVQNKIDVWLELKDCKVQYYVVAKEIDGYRKKIGKPTFVIQEAIDLADAYGDREPAIMVSFLSPSNQGYSYYHVSEPETLYF